METAVEAHDEPGVVDDAPDTSPAPRDAWWRRLLWSSVPYVIAVAVTTAVALWTYRPWKFTGAMASTWGDPLAFHTWVQATIEDGWYEYAGRLSAPYGMNSHTYTVTDEFLFALIGKVFAPLVGDAAGAVTLWVIVCFPLAAIFAVAAARYLDVGRAAALIPGIAFPLLPDHYQRATGHFSLSSVWAVSLGMLVVVSLLRRPRLSGGRRVWFEAAMLTSCVLIGLTNAYYATFTALLVAAAGVGGALALRSWRVLASGVARGVALILPILVAMRLDALYSPQPAGYSSFEVTRSLADAEVYGGKIIAMLLPSPLHRSELFRAVRRHYDATFPNPAEQPALGLVATIGFIALVLWALLGYFRSRPAATDVRLGYLAGLMWFSLLVYVVGGLGSLWALLLDGGGIRVWSRMHWVIGLIALLAVAVAVDRLGRRGLRAMVVAAVLAVVLVDQTTAWARPDPGKAQALEQEVTSYTADVATAAGPTAMIYQAPYVTFPVPNMDVAPASIYDGFLPYLYSTDTDLQWSYGGLQGDPSADWQIGLSAMPFQQAAPLLQAAGFAGVSLDTAAATTLPALLPEIRAALGEPSVTSASGRWLYFDLDLPVSPACAVPEVTDRLAGLAVEPPLLYPGDGLSTAPGFFRNEEGPATVRVVTLHEEGWDEVRVTFTVENPAVDLRVTFPDGSTRELAPGEQIVTWTGAVDAEETDILIERTGEGPAYVLRSLTASTTAGAEAAPCLPEPTMAVPTATEG